jgi:hypothetical protein
MYLSSSTGFDPLEKTSLIVPALNKHDYRHRFSRCIIAVTAAKSWGAELLTRVTGRQQVKGPGWRPTAHDLEKAHLPLSQRAVILRGCDFFDFSCFWYTQPECFSELPQDRHPERSASRIYRLTEGLQRVVEGPRRCLLADAIRSFPATNYKENQKKSQALSEAEGSAVRLSVTFKSGLE